MHSLSFIPSAKKSKDAPKRQREQTEDPEKKRIRKGGPPAIPPTWRNKSPDELVMSFASPEVQDGYTLVVLQSSSQLPAFGRYCIPFAEDIREDRILDNPWVMSTCGHLPQIHSGNHVIRREAYNMEWLPVT